MKKTLIALAVLGAASTVQAQSSVTFYGELNPSYDYVTIKNSSSSFIPPWLRGVKTNTTAMNNNTSFIGFRGTEDLGGGLKAVFQLEANFDLVNDNGFANPPDADRNSFVGLEGQFGTVRFGAIDGAYKRSTASYDAFADTIGDYNSIFGTSGPAFFSYYNNNTTYKQAADYASPVYKGFQVTATYALVTAKVSGYADPYDNTDLTRWDLGVNYTNGPLNLLAAYSSGKDSSNEIKDTWLKFGAAYTFSTNTTVRGMVENVKVDLMDNKVIDRRHWLVGVEQPIGNVDLMANYINTGSNKPTVYSNPAWVGQTGAHAFNVGARYNFSKRTNVMGTYSSLKNDLYGAYGSAAGYYGYPGSTVSGFSVRLKHMF